MKSIRQEFGGLVFLTYICAQGLRNIKKPLIMFDVNKKTEIGTFTLAMILNAFFALISTVFMILHYCDIYHVAHVGAGYITIFFGVTGALYAKIHIDEIKAEK